MHMVKEDHDQLMVHAGKGRDECAHENAEKEARGQVFK